MDFEQESLCDVVTALEKLHKIPICIDHKALEDAGIGTDTPVTRTIEGVSLRSALHLMLHDLGLTYVIADDVLLITTPDEANNRLMTRVYEVGDLVSCRDEKGRLWQDFGSLIEMVTTVIQPTTWDEVGGPGSIKEGLFAHSKILVVSQTADVHEELARLLEDVRKVARKHPGDGKPPLRERPAPKPAIQGAMGGGMGGFGFGMGGASSPGSMSGAGGFGFGMGGASSPGSMSGGGFGFGMGGTSSPGSMSGAGPLAVPAAKPAGDTLPGSPEADPFADPPRHKPAGKKVAEQAFGAAPGTDEPVFDTFSGKPAAKKAASKANVPAASQTPAARKPARPAGHKPFCGTPAQAAASAARKPARPAGHKPLTGVKLACGEEAVRKALDSPTHMDYVDCPLADVLNDLQQQHKIWICIDHKALEDAGIGTDTQITRTLDGIPLRSALKLLLRDLGLTFVYADEVLLITTPDEANNRLETVVYDVADLVQYRDEKGQLWDGYDMLIDAITSSIQPTTWDEVGGSGSVVGGTFGTAKVLAVSQTQEFLNEVDFLLKEIRDTVHRTPGDGKPPLRSKPTPKEPIHAMAGNLRAGQTGGQSGTPMGSPGIPPAPGSGGATAPGQTPPGPPKSR